MRACGVAECGRPFKARGFCRMHYERWMKNGSTEKTESFDRPKPPNTLTAEQHAERIELHVAGLTDSEIAARLGITRTTVTSWRITADLPNNGRGGRDAHERIDARRLELWRLGCTDQDIADDTGFTANVVGAWRIRNGLPINGRVIIDHARPTWTGDAASYGGVHQRLRAQRGPANQRLCVSCGEQARDWAYDNSDPNERRSKFGPYSVDLDRYYPLCGSCHQRADAEYRRRNRDSVIDRQRWPLYEAGLTDKQMARVCGVASASIHNWRTNRNLPSNFRRNSA